MSGRFHANPARSGGENLLFNFQARGIKDSVGRLRAGSHFFSPHRHALVNELKPLPPVL
jgi:hypothetical protein